MTRKTADKAYDYDVAVLGSGIAGAAIAAILARHGLRVVILEAREHPRFAIGESMILETSESMRALAKYFDVPEIGHFASEHAIALIGSSHGVKRHFGFIAHRESEEPDADGYLQAVIPQAPYGHELHLFRQDSDYLMAVAAIRHGADLRQNTKIANVAFDTDGVDIIADSGMTLRAGMVVDGSGFGSRIVADYGLRHAECLTHSRGLFTHMIDLPCVHATGPTQKTLRLPYPMSQGTLHHLFHGGWIWVIPFDNHASASNPLCSVGLMLDPRVHPERPELTPEEEFFEFVSRYPQIERQFSGARSARPWVRSGRLQFATSAAAGDRYCLLGHSSGFVDPLFSKGLYISLSSVGVAAECILDAARNNDYSRKRFAALEKHLHTFAATNDRLVANAYKSFSDARVWRQYSVLWLTGAHLEYLRLATARLTTSKWADYRKKTRDLTLMGGGWPEFYDFERRIHEIMDQWIPGDHESAPEIAKSLRAVIAAYPWIPHAQRAISDGKNHLPKRKLRPEIFFGDGSFMGRGAFKTHFFADLRLLQLMAIFVKEAVRYSRRSFLRRRALGRRDALSAAPPRQSPH